MKPPDGELRTIKETAALMGVCRRTIYTWLKAGRIGYVRTPSGAIRIRVNTLYRRGRP